MFPHEAQEVMAKILFFICATCIWCLSQNLRAEEKVVQFASAPIQISKVIAQ